MTDIYIISGFLGAGKTTLIQKLLAGVLKDRTVALVENDFGEISVDAALLRKGGCQVRELNSGCICCSLTGDFVSALSGLLSEYHPEVILIEPSGVGKLSDVDRCCRDPRITPQARVIRKITVVDVKRCRRYLENFGEFFEDQLTHADAVVLSRTGDYPDAVPAARELILQLNPRVLLFSHGMEQLPEELLAVEESPWEHGRPGTRCGHDHSHGADEAFDTVTIRLPRTVRPSAVKSLFPLLENRSCGEILRMKGILKGPDGFFQIQYLPGELTLGETEVCGHELCFIGPGLDPDRLRGLLAAL